MPSDRNVLSAAHSPAEFIQVAKQISEKLRRPGRDPNEARLHYIRRLGALYVSVIGQIPTLSRRLDSTPYGPFYEFVSAALLFLTRKNVPENIEGDVLKVIKELKNASRESNDNTE